MTTKTSIYQIIPIVVFSALIVAGIVLAWTEPTAPPPQNNAWAPLNVSSGGQAKAGGLVLNTGGAATGLIVDKGNVGIGTLNPSAKLDVAGLIQATGFKMPTGAGAGKVLTSDAAGMGTWQAVSGGGGGGSVCAQKTNCSEHSGPGWPSGNGQLITCPVGKVMVGARYHPSDGNQLFGIYCCECSGSGSGGGAFSDIKYVYKTARTTNPGLDQSASISCPANYVVLSGGGGCSNTDGSQTYLSHSMPIVNGSFFSGSSDGSVPNATGGWYIQCRTTGGATGGVPIWALCGKP